MNFFIYILKLNIFNKLNYYILIILTILFNLKFYILLQLLFKILPTIFIFKFTDYNLLNFFLTVFF